MAGTFAKNLEKALGSRPVKSRFLDGGDIADVSKITLEDGREIVAKRPRMDQPDTTRTEAAMLTHLRAVSGVPVPAVLHQEAGLLVIEFIVNNKVTDPSAAATSVAENLSKLHIASNTNAKEPFGFDTDTFIGPLEQRNSQSANWVDFFAQNRLFAMGDQIARTGRVNSDFMHKLDALIKKLADFLPTNPKSSLLHGDVWRGNLLFLDNQIAGFIDPAISYGHHEMDLAFVDLMGGLDSIFFDAYNQFIKIETGFHEERKAIYQLWPLLVHIKLFGGGYVRDAETIMDHFL
ncbi:fructosamine kinase family protein [Kordiimonas sp. SCSIO 12610]|uniref:fructosamine kinase family protein n=1 Tax=Kordiimonas sp. SCSIO 12610 TaxID=2829597 RepID=UPI00210D0690|nr:fructosamine kinase family protein [Kordiimonas sp. SCSIO 12610]UTW55190.1 fructosamine kinase family protein [Kordiimonas sp. SCSIO 12610]